VFEKQMQLESLKESDPTAYVSIIKDINGLLNGLAGKTASQLLPTDRAFSRVLDAVRKDLGRDIDFSLQADREAIGNAIIKDIRENGCAVTGDAVSVCN
jgi:hypothetical protein